jgi:hypothetical protein
MPKPRGHLLVFPKDVACEEWPSLESGAHLVTSRELKPRTEWTGWDAITVRVTRVAVWQSGSLASLPRALLVSLEAAGLLREARGTEWCGHPLKNVSRSVLAATHRPAVAH